MGGDVGRVTFKDSRNMESMRTISVFLAVYISHSLFLKDTGLLISVRLEQTVDSPCLRLRETMRFFKSLPSALRNTAVIS